MTDTARLRELEAKATPGPWYFDGDDIWCGDEDWKSAEAHIISSVICTQEDTQLIVELRNTASELLAAAEERDALKAENEKLRSDRGTCDFLMRQNADLKAENERMRAVVEAAQAACAAGQEWQEDGGDRKAKTERLIKTNKELDQAVAAMEQNDE